MRGKENGHQPRLLIYIYTSAISFHLSRDQPSREIPWKRVLSFFPTLRVISPFPSPITIIIYFPAFLQIFLSFDRVFFYSSFYRPLRLVSIRFGRDLRISGVVKNKERLGNLRFSKDNREGDGDCRRGRRTTIERGLS